MKRQWTPDELAEHWTLTSRDGELIANKTGATRLGFALLLKFFQHDGRFPHHKGDVPTAAVVYVAQQLGLPPELYAQYAWTGRTLAYHRLQIRQTLDFRESTEQDIEELTVWLREDVLPHDHRPDRAQEAVYARCRAAHLEPPAPKRVERLVRSALRTYEDQVHQQVLEQLRRPGRRSTACSRRRPRARWRQQTPRRQTRAIPGASACATSRPIRGGSVWRAC